MNTLILFNARFFKFLIISSVIFLVSISLANSQTLVKTGTNGLQRAISPEELKPVDISKLAQSSLWMQDIAPGQVSFKDVRNSFNEYWKTRKPGKGSGWKPFKRWEYFWEQRLGEDGQIPNTTQFYKDWLKSKELDSKKESLQEENDNEWQFLGPSSAPQQPSYIDPTGLGRMNCITFKPNNPSIIWAGAAFGGLWRSTNGGGSWETFPFTQFMSIGISDVAVAYSSNTYTNIIYAATGDADAAFGGINCYSIGIIKSNDNGENWSITNFSSQISDGLLINRLLIDPRDTNHVYAATTRGLFVTEDGGVTWDTLTNAFTRDLEFNPDNPDQLWAAFIYGDQTNTLYGLYNVGIFPKEGKDSVAFYAGLQFQYGEVIRMAITVNSKHPNYIYALMATQGGGLHSVIYSSNSGQQWYYMAQTLDPAMGNYTWDLLNVRCDNPDSINTQSQGHYDLCIAANPEDPMDVYIGGVNILRYVGGQNPWRLHAFWTSKYKDDGIDMVHADHHDLKFSEDGELFSAHDGGIGKFNNKISEWVDKSEGLEVTQFYRINSSRTDPGLIIAGSQDNGTSLLRNNQWYYIRGGDGMDCWIDPFDNQVMYNSIYYGDFAVSRDGGNTFIKLIDTTYTGESAEWVTPFAIDPVIPDNIFVGYENLWKAARKGADPFQKISDFEDKDPIRHIAISRKDHDVIYIIKPKAVWMTTDGGTSWESVITGTGNIAITSIAIDPKDPLHFWAARSTYVDEQKIIEYKNGLFFIPEGIPSVPVNVIVHNRNSENNQMFIGTDVGVYFRDDDMQAWEIYGKGLPNVVIQDMDIQYASGKLRAATYGRGLWEVKIVECVIDPPELEFSGSNKLCEGDTLIISVLDDYDSYRWSTGETSKSITVIETGLYTVTVKDEMGCVATSDDITVTVIHPPDVTIKKKNDFDSFCEGDSIRIDAGPTLYFREFQWSNGETGKTVYIKESGTFSVTGITKDGCTKESEVFEMFMLEAPEKPVITLDDNILTCSEALSYQWFFNDQEITGAVGMTLIAEETGYYKVMVANSNECVNMSDPIYVELTNVEEHPGINRVINLHPNPALDIFYIDISPLKSETVSIKITNIIGNTVMILPLVIADGHYQKEVNIRQLPDGIYFVNISIGNDIFVKKIIKQ
ncbi:T9SS type A sorting domain-containing protein [Bacteroidota bacterium]